MTQLPQVGSSVKPTGNAWYPARFVRPQDSVTLVRWLIEAMHKRRPKQ